jgi:competence protein ComER
MTRNAWGSRRGSNSVHTRLSRRLAREAWARFTVPAIPVSTHCSLIFLCLSASDTASVFSQLDTEFSPAQLLLTTAAAIPLKMLEDRVPCRAGKLIPSITQEVGAGVTLLMY